MATPEIGAMGDRHYNTQRKHRGEVGGQRASCLAEREGDGQGQQQRLARQPGGGQRQQRPADSDADGIARHEIAGCRNGDAEPERDLGKTPAMTNSVVP
jgi:hypothetical protein